MIRFSSSDYVQYSLLFVSLSFSPSSDDEMRTKIFSVQRPVLLLQLNYNAPFFLSSSTTTLLHRCIKV